MYMSYCRYEGTLSELKVCLEDAAEHQDEMAEYAVSKREIDKFREMVEYFYNWCDRYSLINQYGELDEEMLDEICESMQKSYTEEDS